MRGFNVMIAVLLNGTKKFSRNNPKNQFSRVREFESQLSLSLAPWKQGFKVFSVRKLFLQRVYFSNLTPGGRRGPPDAVRACAIKCLVYRTISNAPLPSYVDFKTHCVSSFG